MLLHCAASEAIEEFSHFVFTDEEDKYLRNCARVLEM